MDETTTLTELKVRWNEVVEPIVARHQGRIFKRMATACWSSSAVPSAPSNAQPTCRRPWPSPMTNNRQIDALYCASASISAMSWSTQRPLWGRRRCRVPHRGACRSGRGGDFGWPARACAWPCEHQFHRQRQSRGQEHRTAAAHLDWSPDADTVEAVGGSPLPLRSTPSIAVLPFDNMSGDPEQGYFADGITEDIITDLSKVSSLFVIARNSSPSPTKAWHRTFER